MSTYQAPLKEMHFLLETVAPLAELCTFPHFADATPDTVAAILEESAKFATEVLDTKVTARWAARACPCLRTLVAWECRARW